MPLEVHQVVMKLKVEFMESMAIMEEFCGQEILVVHRYGLYYSLMTLQEMTLKMLLPVILVEITTTLTLLTIPQFFKV